MDAWADDNNALVKKHTFLWGLQEPGWTGNYTNAATDLPIYISEYDVDDANDAGQLAKYMRLFPLVWGHPAVRGVTLWGYQQGRVWRGNAYLYRTDGTARPACTWLIQYLKDHPPDPFVVKPSYRTARSKTAPAPRTTFNLRGQQINDGAGKTVSALTIRPGENKPAVFWKRIEEEGSTVNR